MVRCMFIWIYYASFVESNDLRLTEEACLEYYGTFKKPREYMSQVTTTKCKVYDTNRYIFPCYIWWLGFCCQHMNIWEHIYKALHQCYIKITFCGAKVSNAVLVGLYNTRHDSSASSTWFAATYSPQNDHRHVWVSLSCPNSPGIRMLTWNWAPMDTRHWNYFKSDTDFTDI